MNLQNYASTSLQRRTMQINPTKLSGLGRGVLQTVAVLGPGRRGAQPPSFAPPLPVSWPPMIFAKITQLSYVFAFSKFTEVLQFQGASPP